MSADNNPGFTPDHPALEQMRRSGLKLDQLEGAARKLNGGKPVAFSLTPEGAVEQEVTREPEAPRPRTSLLARFFSLLTKIR